MLTQKTISSQHKSNKSPHSANINTFQNIFNFLFSSTHDIFCNSTVDVPTSKQFLAPADDTIFKRANWNSTPAQKELLLWHYCLGHIAIPHVQLLLQKQHEPQMGLKSKERIIIPVNNKCSHIDTPLCAACQFFKQKRQISSSHTTGKLIKAGGSSDNILKPGQRVSTDLYSSTARGHLLDTFGRESPDKQYTGGAIFVAFALKFVHACHQVGTIAAETVLSKHKSESFCSQHGVTVKEYLVDNQPYRSDDWKTDGANQRQYTIYSGVGNKIKTLLNDINKLSSIWQEQ